MERVILTTPAVEITEINQDIIDFYCDLEDTFNEHLEEASGLASNQIWTTVKYPPPAMFVFKTGFDGQYVIALNPKIKGTGKKIKKYEGCLSLRDRKPVIKKRDKNVTISYMDIDGDHFVEKYTLDVARTIFHEYDHLLGKVI
jgi:peptide deformylase